MTRSPATFFGRLRIAKNTPAASFEMFPREEASPLKDPSFRPFDEAFDHEIIILMEAIQTCPFVSAEY